MKNLPEKIYATPNFDRRWQTKAIDDESVEYTRTDAFVEKAYEWIKSRWSETNDRFKEDYTGMLFEDFKKYMEE